MIIIPDIHGRSFWKEAIAGRESEEILFLGDYVDPYTMVEDVEYWDGMKALYQVMEFKMSHMDNVTLLLGNHDLSYITSYLPKCRHDFENHDTIKQLLKDNLSLFQIAHEKQIAGKHYLFTHAGILPGWLEEKKRMPVGCFSISRIRRTIIASTGLLWTMGSIRKPIMWVSLRSWND